MEKEEKIDIFKTAVESEYEYIAEYESFMKGFNLTEIGAEEIGALIAKMSMFYSRYNLKMGDALRKYSRVKADFQTQVDEANGKPMSSAKAETLSAATDESASYELARIHLANIEQNINALKALQKGVLLEYAHSA